jgi:hypothetical protein
MPDTARPTGFVFGSTFRFVDTEESTVSITSAHAISDGTARPTGFLFGSSVSGCSYGTKVDADKAVFQPVSSVFQTIPSI